MKIEGLNIGFRVAGPKFRPEALRIKEPRQEGGPLKADSAAEQKKALSESVPEKKVQVGPYRAYFAVDENNNVVIRVVDDKGNVVRQIPPEEYIKMKEALRETIKNLLDLEA